jgi:phage terminase large subunit GpA-like protein
VIRVDNSALRIVGSALAEILEPQPDIDLVEWSRGISAPDGPRAGQPLDLLGLTPFWIEPLRLLTSDTGDCNTVTICKSSQVGASTLAQVWLANIIDQSPADTLLLMANDSQLREWLNLKLNRLIDKTPFLRSKVLKQVARSGEASTIYEKKLKSGFSISMGIASSLADLRGKSVKYAIADEIDAYLLDLSNQGSPLEMLYSRQLSFQADGSYKRLLISTPSIEGESIIWKLYLEGDQRRWACLCPQCKERFTFEPENLRHNEKHPFNAYHLCTHCGYYLQQEEKTAVVRTGEWIPTAPGPGKQPSFFISSLESPFVTMNYIVGEKIKVGEDISRAKTFQNLILGRPFQVDGDAPDYTLLMQRREPGFERGVIPADCLLFTIGCDVQGDGIWHLCIGWKPNRESVVVDYGFLPGAITDAESGAFLALSELYERKWKDSAGRVRWFDAFAVDSGFATQQVYNWTRARPRASATKGAPGWVRPRSVLARLLMLSIPQGSASSEAFASGPLGLSA